MINSLYGDEDSENLNEQLSVLTAGWDSAWLDFFFFFSNHKCSCLGLNSGRLTPDHTSSTSGPEKGSLIPSLPWKEWGVWAARPHQAPGRPLQIQEMPSWDAAEK